MVASPSVPNHREIRQSDCSINITWQVFGGYLWSGEYSCYFWGLMRYFVQA